MKEWSFPVWKRLSSRVVLQRGKYLRVEDHQVELPDGRVIENWPLVFTPDVINVLARTREGKYLCFRERKYAVGGVTMATVGGMVESGEQPLEAAKRELLEETGYRSENWIHLGRYILDANRKVGQVDMYLALDAVRVAEPDSDDLEEQELIEVSREVLQERLFAGDFQVLPWTAAIALSLLHEQANGNLPE
jgi:ADP-ribose pyrophosphatase